METAEIPEALRDDRDVEEGRLTGKAIGMELPADVLGKIEELRVWARSFGEQGRCALFCAFHPLVAEIDARAGDGTFNPTGVQDVDVVRARRILIQLRDVCLMPTLWHTEYVVLFSHAIKALWEIQHTAFVTGLETDGVGEETG